MAVSEKTWQGPVTTSVAALATLIAGQKAWISQIRIVNFHTTNCWLKMWMDFDGSTYDDTTIIWPQQTIPPGKIVFDTGLLIVGPGGNVAVQAEANSKIVVHLMGIIRT